MHINSEGKADRYDLEPLGAKAHTKVVQLTGRAPVDYQHFSRSQAPQAEALLESYDEVTVELDLGHVRATSVELRLPAQTRCSGKHCDNDVYAYSFVELPDKQGCFFRVSDRDRRPSNQAEMAVDLVGQKKVSKCRVKNLDDTGGDTEATQHLHRPSLQLSLYPTDEHTWAFFTVFVRNPLASPSGTDGRGNLANTFEVLVWTPDSVDVAEATEALDIRMPWICGYTRWQRSAHCTSKCGGGQRLYFRDMLHPPPQGIDPAMKVRCGEAVRASERCNVQPCDVDCALGDWTRWADGPCSSSCRGGWEVQRRPIERGNLGKGKPCAGLNSEERVRYVECNANVPCPPACERARAIAVEEASSPNVIVGGCSAHCGGGNFTTLGLGIRKDAAFDATKCLSQNEEPCNREACDEMGFFASEETEIPVSGKWYDVTLQFHLTGIAETLELHAPPGYELGALRGNGRQICWLKEHNLPSMTACDVADDHPATGQQSLKFTFRYALEPKVPGLGHYVVRLWVKHPQACERRKDDSEVALCAGAPHDRQWELYAKEFHEVSPDAARSEGFATATYEYYDADAPPGVKRMFKVAEQVPPDRAEARA